MTFPKSQHALIYCDPPWKYEMYSAAGEDKSPQKHYPCMDLDEMKALRDDLLFATAPNAAMVMWTTFAFLPAALDLMAHWGFTYKTGGVWHKMTENDKSAFGTGYILRSTCEPFLIGTLGAPKIKNRATRNLFTSLRREHSRKPDEMYTLIERLFDGPYLELFARTTRPGWTSWGNQTDKFGGDHD